MNNSLLGEIRTRINRLDGHELNEIVYMVNDQRRILAKQAAGDLWVNKPVSFDNDGYRFYGKVVKVNRKNSKVQALREDNIGNEGYNQLKNHFNDNLMVNNYLHLYNH